MKLLDTNVINYARDKASPWHGWAKQAIEDAAYEEGAGVNAVVLAELSAWVKQPEALPAELQAMGIEILDVPASAALICGKAYRDYLKGRKSQSGQEGPTTPLPDFFIGAHAAAIGAGIVTNDPGRFKTYFPKVKLMTP